MVHLDGQLLNVLNKPLKAKVSKPLPLTGYTWCNSPDIGKNNFAFSHLCVTLGETTQIAGSIDMEAIAQFVDFFHGLSNTFIVAIIGVTMLMSVFLYKVLIDSDFFSNYDRNL